MDGGGNFGRYWWWEQLGWLEAYARNALLRWQTWRTGTPATHTSPFSDALVLYISREPINAIDHTALAVLDKTFHQSICPVSSS